MAQRPAPTRRRPPRVLYRLLNPLIELIPHSPAHGMLSGRLILLTFYGRKSGRRYTIPVGYARTDGTLLLGTEYRWWKNLRGGAPVEVRLRGEVRPGIADVVTDEEGMAEAYQTMLAAAPEYLRAIGVSSLPDGRPRQEDVARVRREGHVVVRVRLDRPLGTTSFGQAEAGDEAAPGVARLALGVVNAYVVGEVRGPWVLVDAGTPGNAQRIRAEAEERFGTGARPEAIVLTHDHADHSGSAAELSGSWDVPVYAHRLELPFLTGLSAYPPPDPTVGGPLALLSRFIPRKTIDLNEERARELPAGGVVPGMSDWRWMHTPGHTPGHVCLWRPADRVLLAGDAVATVDADSLLGMLSRKQQISRPATPVTPDWEAAERSVKEMAALRPRVLAPGHGEPLKGPTVAEKLEVFAEDFTAPEHGRYVGEPARFDERGVAWLPPAPSDPLPKVAAALGVALLAGAAAFACLAATRRRGRRA
jgi:deazaflavin-dependent oxidoreductase (nitroreductase family)